MIEKINTIKEVLEKGINKSLDRLNRASSLKWEIESIKFEISKSDFNALCVYLISLNYNKLAFLLVVNQKDVEVIFKNFSGREFNKYSVLAKIGELFVSEIGNIILNSVLGEIANKLDGSIIPDIPKTVNGNKLFLLENISSLMEENKNKIAVSSTISIKSGSSSMAIELYFFIDNDVIKKI